MGDVGRDYNNQTTNNTTSLKFENVAVDGSTQIGLQGDDLANLLNALNQKDAISQTAILANNNQLATIVKSNNETTQNTVNSIKSSLGNAGKYIFLGFAVFGSFWAYKKFVKNK